MDRRLLACNPETTTPHAASIAIAAAELDPVVVAVRVAGDTALLAPRVAVLSRQVDADLHLRDIASASDRCGGPASER
jgi:hypothetical protein